MITVGKHGPTVRSDVRIEVSDAPKASYNFASTVAAMYGRAIRSQVEAVLGRYGDPAIHLVIVDSGALPFAFEARLEAAICQHLGLDLPSVPARSFDAPRERLRRTRLYLPGDEPKLLPNAFLYGADMLVLDLEDSVAPDCKFAARAMVREALRSLDFGSSEVAVRINQGEEGIKDLEAVVQQGVQCVLVPKVEGPQTIEMLAKILDRLSVPTHLIPLIESAKGVHRAFEIAAASERVVAVTIGLEDYAADLGAERSSSGDESVFALGQLVNAARAADVTPLASVFPQAADPDATFAYALKMRGLGFEGIGCIHPSQVRHAHRAFTPSKNELTSAKAIVDAFDRAIEEGKGAVAVNGRMVDAPVYRRAKTLLLRGDSR